MMGKTKIENIFGDGYYFNPAGTGHRHRGRFDIYRNHPGGRTH